LTTTWSDKAIKDTVVNQAAAILGNKTSKSDFPIKTVNFLRL